MPSRWSGVGWVESDEGMKLSPCHGAKVYVSLGDGVLAGSCAECGEDVVRLNPKTRRWEVAEVGETLR